MQVFVGTAVLLFRWCNKGSKIFQFSSSYIAQKIIVDLQKYLILYTKYRRVFIWTDNVLSHGISKHFSFMWNLMFQTRNIPVDNWPSGLNVMLIQCTQRLVGWILLFGLLNCQHIVVILFCSFLRWQSLVGIVGFWALFF